MGSIGNQISCADRRFQSGLALICGQCPKPGARDFSDVTRSPDPRSGVAPCYIVPHSATFFDMENADLSLYCQMAGSLSLAECHCGSGIGPVAGIGRYLACLPRYHFPRNRLIVFTSISVFRVWHSQTVKTAQRNLRSFRRFRWSRALFPESFFTQYFRRTAGIRHWPQVCMCQKQPLTMIIFRSLGRTISGVPGRSRRCRRKR